MYRDFECLCSVKTYHSGNTVHAGHLESGVPEAQFFTRAPCIKMKGSAPQKKLPATRPTSISNENDSEKFGS